MSRLRVFNIRFYVLCQACLRIDIYSHAKHTELEFCQCGGQWCGCEDCNDTANQLLRGERDHKALALQRPITHWSPVTGIEMKGAAA